MPPVERQVRMDVVKLVKRHAFRENPFFDEEMCIRDRASSVDYTDSPPREGGGI